MDDGFARAGAEVQIDVRSGANGTGWDQLEILISTGVPFGHRRPRPCCFCC
jgi:hypothetical protein